MSQIHQVHGELAIAGGFDRPLATLWLDASDINDVFAPPVWESEMWNRCESPEILAAQLKEHTGVTLSSEFKQRMLLDLALRRGNEVSKLPDVDKDGNPLTQQPRYSSLEQLLSDQPTTSQED
jgi:hypothetical protein